MPRGATTGRRAGPAPDPNALRRERDSGEWVTLPAEGRAGDPPDWPLPGGSERELVVWADLWSRPQAVEWERQRQEMDVAFYARHFAEAEQPEAGASARALVIRLADSLGLTTPGLRSNRWKIAPAVDDAPKAAPARSKSRARLKVVAADAVEGTDVPG
jgi:hypothetical protein